MHELTEVFTQDIDPSQILANLDQIRVNTLQYAKFVGILIFGILFISSLTRFLFGKKAQINLAVTSAVEIFCVYVVNILIYALGLNLQQFLTPLPFVAMVEDYLILYPILSAEFTDICHHVLKLLIIAFLVNAVNDFIPKGEHVITWFLLRFLTVVLAVLVICGTEMLLGAYIPQGLAEIAPTVLVCCLVALILLGGLKILVGAALAFLDPITAALYTFFFSNFLGRALARAMVSTALLTGVVVLLDVLNIAVVPIAAAMLTSYIPLLLIILVLWYFIGHIL
jgi:hypothetical protein